MVAPIKSASDGTSAGSASSVQRVANWRAHACTMAIIHLLDFYRLSRRLALRQAKFRERVFKRESQRLSGARMLSYSSDGTPVTTMYQMIGDLGDRRVRRAGRKLSEYPSVRKNKGCSVWNKIKTGIYDMSGGMSAVDPLVVTAKGT